MRGGVRMNGNGNEPQEELQLIKRAKRGDVKAFSQLYAGIYTELYNGDPNENPEGYDQNSPIFFADRLRGKLLIAHGTGDDNVHIQQTYEMLTQLIKHDKPYEMYIYPDQNHGMGSGRHHLMERCLEFVHRNL